METNPLIENIKQLRQQALETRKAIIDWLDETCDVGIQQLKDAKNDRIKNVNSNCDSFLKWLDERQQEIEEKLNNKPKNIKHHEKV